jgi:hypothetical protein
MFSQNPVAAIGMVLIVGTVANWENGPTYGSETVTWMLSKNEEVVQVPCGDVREAEPDAVVTRELGAEGARIWNGLGAAWESGAFSVVYETAVTSPDRRNPATRTTAQTAARLIG